MENNKERVYEYSIPQDIDSIIFKVLKELPVKSLLRLRCVSKLWCSIIDDPIFVQSHHTRSLTRPGGTYALLLFESHEGTSVSDENEGILHEGQRSLYTADLEGGPAVHLLTPPYRRLLLSFQSVNGLVCIDNCIWNLSTRESKTLPPLTMTCDDIMVGQNSWRFDSYCLLGFDPCSKKHKVLNMCFINFRRSFDGEIKDEYSWYGLDPLLQCKILTIGTNSWSWRNIDSVPHSLKRFQFDIGATERSCCINGVIYCLGSIGSEKSVIVAFDVGQEKFEIMPVPDVPTKLGDTDSHFYPIPIQVKEHLALIDCWVKRISILEDYTKQLWTTQRLIFSGDYGEESFDPVGTIHTGEILLKSYDDQSKLFFYNLESKRLRVCQLSNLPADIIRYPSEMHLSIYVESLFQLKAEEVNKKDC